MPAKPRLRTHAAGWSRLVSSLVGCVAVNEAVATRVRFDGRPEEVWDHIMFYEEVPGRPAFLLRTLLPYPVRAEGDKTQVGETVRCAYRGGQRITASEPPHLLRFEVIEQRWGIERCILTLGGSYHIQASGDASEVGTDHGLSGVPSPRYLWRPLEVLPVKQSPHSHPPRYYRRRGSSSGH